MIISTMSARECIKHFTNNPYIGLFQYKTSMTYIKVQTRTVGTQTDEDPVYTLGWKIISECDLNR